LDLVKKTSNLIESLTGKYSRPLFLSGADLPSVKPAPTGILGLDMALAGGLPRGGVTIISGKENSMKTTLAILAARNCLPLLYLDADRSYNEAWFSGLGLDSSQVLVAYPESMEEAWDILSGELRNPTWGSFIVDSLGMLSPDKEMTSRSEDPDAVGLRARLTNKLARKVMGSLTPYSSSLIVFVNHLYASIGSVPMPDEMPCGAGIRFAALVTVNLKRTERIPTDRGKTLEGVRIQWRVDKSKVSPHGGIGTFTFWIAEGEREGVEMPAGTIDLAEQFERYMPDVGLLERAGGYYNLNLPSGKSRFQGKSAMRSGVLQHQQAIYDAVFSKGYTPEGDLKRRHAEYMEAFEAERAKRPKGRAKKAEPEPVNVPAKHEKALRELRAVGVALGGAESALPDDDGNADEGIDSEP